ncbi:threonine--tRNA ligase, mitochondrial [Protopterus annectens]|uniref:threonine--tRNA ligase, mitochondrial n=1 Tax=Protopterus annectens TaxID=7888 RepID=UPI001CFBAD18|nr:threonine--tRNA ligase, mitochondrial [Protopterus annectens]
MHAQNFNGTWLYFALQANTLPFYIPERILLFEKLKTSHYACLAERIQHSSLPIRIFMPDGKELKGESLITTPYEIASQISQELMTSAVVARVNGILWDLNRPLEEDSNLELLKFDSPGGKEVYWHSSSHVLGAAMEQLYGALLCRGPSTESGFYYDMFHQGSPVSNSDYPALEEICRRIIKEKHQFERIVVSRDDLFELFKYNKFKLRMINEKVTTPTASVYRCGSLIDLCRGPHIRHTGQIKAFKILKNSSAFWNGDPSQETLQRIYAISFPSSKQLKEWEQIQEEARNRDHRKIGREQELFFFHELSPGSCFFLPKGAHIYNTLVDFIKTEYWKRGYTEVVTPNIFNTKLWEKSGHWEHYRENMFSFRVENDTFALKPMNCPGHCLIYDHRPRSWRELPLRLADFGVLHRNEVSGALSGLTRVRRFQQDDAHIFCTMEQLEDEMNGCLEFLHAVYSVFGFTFRLHLSTRPEKFLGEIETWDEAEKLLERSLNSFGLPWELNAGDGAFYGPKIDIHIQDAIKRYHQCATIQLDFQMPAKFDLSYVRKDGSTTQRPVMIHRAILGSVERMIAILVENYAGKWPFWLSPFQVMVIPVAGNVEDYAQVVHQKFHDAGFIVDIDLDPGSTLNRKIRKAQLAQFNFILVVGEKEKLNGTVNVRTRDNKQHGERGLQETVARLKELKDSRVEKAEEQF